MGNARVFFLVAMSAVWLPACREEPPAPGEATAAGATSDGASASRWIELEPASTGLAALLAGHAQRAGEQGLAPVLYVGASWCQPCKLLEQHRDDPQVARALRGTYTIELDFDDWTVAELSASGYEMQAVPVFFAIGADGKAAGPRLDGGPWIGSAEQIAAAFERFLHQM